MNDPVLFSDIEQAIGSYPLARAVWLRYGNREGQTRAQTWANVGKALGISGNAAQLRVKKGIRLLRHPQNRAFVCTRLPATHLLSHAIWHDIATREHYCHAYL